MKVWLTEIPEGTWPLPRVRNAMRVFDPTATARTAQDVIDQVREHGFGVLGETSAFVDVDKAREIIEEAGGRITLRQPKPEQIEAKRMTADGASPEEVFAETAPGEPQTTQSQKVKEITDAIQLSDKAKDVAAFLLAHTDGSPLNACQMALGLQRITGDDTYAQAVAHMVIVFQPWLAKMLHQQGLVQIKENA